ncbi:hypothetical protein Ancab_007487 [Ancistrocladus abbreviatus]
MEIPATNQEKGGLLLWLREIPQILIDKFINTGRVGKKLAKDDPRRVAHSIKVGLAITLVSLFYYYEFYNEGFGESAMWAVLTVVVVFEYSVGMLGVGARQLASLSGEKAEPIFIGLFVFLIGATITFFRFFPKMKARYDYGLMVSILTFSLVTVSGYHSDKVLETAKTRTFTILIGWCLALSVSILICPVWAGDDLHNLAANNIEKLGNFLQEFGGEYFKSSKDGISAEKKAYMEGFKSVLTSKSNEDSLINFARWEPPRYRRFGYNHPWKHYRQIGSLSRQCACRIEALNGYLHAKIQSPPEVKGKIEVVCTEMSSETSKALKELSVAIKTMTRASSSAKSHIENAKLVARGLNSRLRTGLWNDTNLTELIPALTVTSLLADVVSCTEKLAESVEELASLSNFDNIQMDAKTVSDPKPRPKLVEAGREGPHFIIRIEGSPPKFPTYKDPASLELPHHLGVE